MLSACVSSSEIVPVGKDSYVVNGRAMGGVVGGESIIAASKAANAFCEKQGKFVVVRSTETSGHAAWGGERSGLIFSCVTADDPEYKRPDLKPAQ